MAVLLRALTLLLALLAATTSADTTKSGNLRDESALAESARPMRRLSAVWSSPDSNNMARLQPIDKLTGGDAIVVFNDRASGPEAQAESAVVSFDVRSSANCVVSVCGTQRKWYTGAREKCFDLRVASKSGNPDENGLIRGISAAYVGWRPVAENLYLKFDATNFIDGSRCEYTILSGSKVIREDAMGVGASASAASSPLS